VSGGDPFPWGDRDPVGGYKVGDRVGIIYSDHDNYIFDNPDGEVVAVDHDGDRVGVTISVQVTVWDPEKLYLVKP
jgi:hypothetical protein